MPTKSFRLLWRDHLTQPFFGVGEVLQNEPQAEPAYLKEFLSKIRKDKYNKWVLRSAVCVLLSVLVATVWSAVMEQRHMALATQMQLLP